MSWQGTLTEKSVGCDFDINDFDEANFEVHGWGWTAKLSEKAVWVRTLTEKVA